MIDADEDYDTDSSGDGEEFVGVRSNRRRTNWRFRSDALSQQDMAFLSHLEMRSNGIFTQIQGTLIAIAILTTILAVCHRFRIFRGATDGNLVKIIQVLTLSVAMFQGIQISIRNEMNDILLIHQTDRIYLPFPPKKIEELMSCPRRMPTHGHASPRHNYINYIFIYICHYM